MNLFGKNNVGIITFKDLGDFPKALGYNVECYGNLRGTNKLENKPVLVLIGTYQPIVPSWYPNVDKNEKEYFDDLLSKYFLLDASEENLKTVGVEAPDFVSKKYDFPLGKTYSQKYVGKIGELYATIGDLVVQRPAQTLATLFWYDEIYQAFHRNRPLRHERIIFSYCWFPEPNARIFKTKKNGKRTIVTDEVIDSLRIFNHNIREEFKAIKKFKDDDINELFDFLSETEYGKGGIIEDIISDILQDPKITSKDLTAKYKIQKTEGKRGADTIPMTTLIKTVNELKSRAEKIIEE
jgi:hypothetical protein